MSTENLEKINFNKKILNWFYLNQRSLPFRQNKDPYRILVSEIMAQQTQISTLVPYFNRFLEKFPSFFSLADSSEEEVLKLWEGLGYYSRAKNLRKAAIAIKELGYFPDSYEELIKLPGIGPYTAGAVLSIAFNQKIPAIDGNVLRVLTRYYGIWDDINNIKTKRKIENIVLEHLEETESPGDFNQAVMELGALICIKKSPKCLLCPLKNNCYAYINQKVDELPYKSKPKEKQLEFYDVLIPLKDNKPLFIKRYKEKLLSGLDGFPMENNNGISGEGLKKILSHNDLEKTKFIGTSKHTFTHKIWISSVYIINLKFIPDKFTDKPVSVPTAFKKMVKLIKKN